MFPLARRVGRLSRRIHHTRDRRHKVQRPYRLSLYYEVRVVNLDSETADRRRMVDGHSLGYGMGAPAP